mmetsp:Transcript_79432/g.233421  ORF Transcript_79432/g.233421 Transcript_79432/m.233421 type:complete len:337 (+) Transcript_79432:210-1220(+)
MARQPPPQLRAELRRLRRRPARPPLRVRRSRPWPHPWRRLRARPSPQRAKLQAPTALQLRRRIRQAPLKAAAMLLGRLPAKTSVNQRPKHQPLLPKVSRKVSLQIRPLQLLHLLSRRPPTPRLPKSQRRRLQVQGTTRRPSPQVRPWAMRPQSLPPELRSRPPWREVLRRRREPTCRQSRTRLSRPSLPQGRRQRMPLLRPVQPKTLPVVLQKMRQSASRCQVAAASLPQTRKRPCPGTRSSPCHPRMRAIEVSRWLPHREVIAQSRWSLRLARRRRLQRRRGSPLRHWPSTQRRWLRHRRRHTLLRLQAPRATTRRVLLAKALLEGPSPEGASPG